MKKRVCLILVAMAILLSAQAQESSGRMIFDQAESEYEIGRIEQAMDLLKRHKGTFSDNLKVSVYKLLALCNLALDNDDEAVRYVNLILHEDPYFTTSLQDPQRFSDIVSSLKSGLTNSTITTASSQEENMNEVPVPVTLITADMIRNSGATNLQEVLAAYVPGMNIVDCNDDINIAMRGIYSNGQEKILIMLNGHRLNNYSTNIAAPDFSIGLEKLKQIEVLRGPASSLYGNVALTAVVNLITKQGADIDGFEVKAGIGNYGQMRGSFLFGKRYFNIDLMVWGNIYKANGQVVYDPIAVRDTSNFYGGKTTIGNIGNKPSYDAGFQLKWGNLRLMYNTRFSQIVSPYTLGYMHYPYNIDAYNTYNGIKPSFATQAHHADLSYEHQFNKLSLKGTFSYDNGDLTHYQVISDSIIFLAHILGLNNNKQLAFLDTVPGVSRYINGQEQTICGQLKSDFNYLNNGQHIGTLSFGAEYTHYRLSDSRYVLGYNFNKKLESSTLDEYGKGHENSFNTYIQLKHKWKSLILNAGLRYDTRHDYEEEDTREFSPRFSLILLRPKWNIKWSYSKSFINAPYLYRKANTQIAVLKGTEAIPLTKETMHSYQISFGGTQWFKGFDFEVNAFYNRAQDLIFQTIIEHMNTGNIDTYGLELLSSYDTRKFSMNLAACWQKNRKSSIFGYNFNNTFNIPAISANIVLGWRVNKHLLLHGHLSFEGQKTAYEINLYHDVLTTVYKELLEQARIENDTEFAKDLEKALAKVDERPELTTKESTPLLLVNVGGQYTINKLSFSLNVRNLFNSRYYRSGMGTGLVRQKGRWLTFDVAYKF